MSSTDGLQDFHRWGPGQDTISCPLPVFSFICEHLCHLWIKTPSPDRKRAGPGLAAKRRKRRKKDGASELSLHVSQLQFCSVGRIDPSLPDRPVRTTLQKQEIA